jgi:hypothetical protein
MIKTRRSPDWSTSSLEGSADQTPAELGELTRQLRNCNNSRGWFFRLKSAVDSADGFARARFVSTLVLVTVAFVTTLLFL